MSLTPGMRLARGARDAYEIVGGGWTGTRHLYVRARKVFWNFRYPAEALDEAGADEGLDVLVRVPLAAGEGPGGSPPDFERDAIFALPGASWFLEPVDWLEPLDDPAATSRAPLLVLADPHAERLSAGPPPDATSAGRRARMLSDLLAALDMLHRAGLAAGPLDPGDFLLDETGRWFYLGTDRIGPGSPDLSRADLAHWSRLSAVVLTGSGRLEDLDARPWPEASQYVVDWIKRGGADDPRTKVATPDASSDEAPSRRGLFGFWRWGKR